MYGLWLVELFPYLDRLGDESKFGYIDHDNVVLDSSSYLVESEILRENNRTRKSTIKTLLYKKALCFKIYWCLMSVSRESEYVTRESDINLTWVDTCNRCYNNDGTRSIKDIYSNLSNISIMIMSISDVYFDGMGIMMMIIMYMSIPMSILTVCIMRFCMGIFIVVSDSEDFEHR